MKDDLTLRTNLPAGQTNLRYDQADANWDRLMYWSGQWTAGTYTQNEVVSNNGMVWICTAASTTSEPALVGGGGGSDWERLIQRTTELWQVTPIIGMVASVLQWTFVPLQVGQTPILTTHAAGVHTFNSNGAVIDVRLTAGVTMNISANNEAVEWTISPTYTGAGLSTVLGMGGSMGSPRGSAFPATNLILGEINPTSGDTLSFTGNSLGDGTSLVDLDAAYLQITGAL